MWEELGEGAFPAVDFAKAYDSVRHAFFEAVLLVIGLAICVCAFAYYCAQRGGFLLCGRKIFP